MNKDLEKYFNYWIPIFQKMRFIYKLQGNLKAIIELEDEIWKNWKIPKSAKREILKIIRGGKLHG